LAPEAITQAGANDAPVPLDLPDGTAASAPPVDVLLVSFILVDCEVSAFMPNLRSSADTGQDAVLLLSFLLADCAVHAAPLLAHQLANHSLAPARDNVAPTPFDLLHQAAGSAPTASIRALVRDAFCMLCATRHVFSCINGNCGLDVVAEDPSSGPLFILELLVLPLRMSASFSLQA